MRVVMQTVFVGKLPGQVVTVSYERAKLWVDTGVAKLAPGEAFVPRDSRYQHAEAAVVAPPEAAVKVKSGESPTRDLTDKSPPARKRRGRKPSKK